MVVFCVMACRNREEIMAGNGYVQELLYLENKQVIPVRLTSVENGFYNLKISYKLSSNINSFNPLLIHYHDSTF